MAPAPAVATGLFSGFAIPQGARVLVNGLAHVRKLFAFDLPLAGTAVIDKSTPTALSLVGRVEVSSGFFKGTAREVRVSFEQIGNQVRFVAMQAAPNDTSGAPSKIEALMDVAASTADRISLIKAGGAARADVIAVGNKIVIRYAGNEFTVTRP